jgi:nucleoside 2-deoxyribosyltransferase
MTRHRIYLAGPAVFRPDAIVFAERIKKICAEHGCEGLFPLDNDPGIDRHDKRATAKWIYAANIAMMDRADAIVADISPFRGFNMDPGTAFEIGWFAARERPIFLWTNDPRSLYERTAGFKTPFSAPCYDTQGMMIEDFDLPENLMVSVPALAVLGSPREAIQAAANHFATT